MIDRLYSKSGVGEPYRSWFLNATLFAAPEWGIPLQDANTWLDALKNRATEANKWDLFRKELFDRRQHIVRSYLRGVLDDAKEKAAYELIEDINKRASGYDWKILIEDLTP